MDEIEVRHIINVKLPLRVLMLLRRFQFGVSHIKGVSFTKYDIENQGMCIVLSFFNSALYLKIVQEIDRFPDEEPVDIMFWEE